MKQEENIFKIESNKAIIAQGKVLISEPFLSDATFGRSVVLLIDHNEEGSMGLIINKELPFLLNDVVNEFKYLDNIPLYKGGPMSTDTLFYLHTIPDIPHAFPINKGLYINGDFEEIKRYVLQGNPIEGRIRFFLGYSGWEQEQLNQEIIDNSWMISKEDPLYLLSEKSKHMWSKSLQKLGGKYEVWSRFPQIPSLN